MFAAFAMGSSISSSPGPHRYWRVNISANNGDANNYLSVLEIEMRGTIGGSDLCSGGTSIASSSLGGFDKSAAFDNNSGTYWIEGTGPTGWIGYDFGGSPQSIVQYTIMGAVFSAEARAPKNWTFQWSDDSTNWTTVHTVTNSTGWTATEVRTFTI